MDSATAVLQNIVDKTFRDNFFKVAKATTVFIPIAKARGFPLAFR
jgi:hypothetical protein